MDISLSGSRSNLGLHCLPALPGLALPTPSVGLIVGALHLHKLQITLLTVQPAPGPGPGYLTIHTPLASLIRFSRPTSLLSSHTFCLLGLSLAQYLSLPAVLITTQILLLLILLRPPSWAVRRPISLSSGTYPATVPFLDPCRHDASSQLHRALSATSTTRSMIFEGIQLTFDIGTATVLTLQTRSGIFHLLLPMILL